MLAKNSGMVSTCPMPINRSRVFTRQAMISESDDGSLGKPA